MRIIIDLTDAEAASLDRYREYLISGSAAWAETLRALGFTTSEAVHNLVREGLWHYETRMAQQAEPPAEPAELVGLAELDNVVTVLVPAWLRSLQSQTERES